MAATDERLIEIVTKVVARVLDPVDQRQPNGTHPSSGAESAMGPGLAMQATVDEIVRRVTAELEFQQYSRDCDYMEKNRTRLLCEYQREWIAIFGDQVVTHSPDFEAVMSTLAAMRIVGRSVIEFMTDDERPLR